MSTKEWFYSPENSTVGGYQEITLEDKNDNPAIIQIENPPRVYHWKTW